MAERGSTFWRKEKAESWFCVYRVLEKIFLKKKNYCVNVENCEVSEVLVLCIYIDNKKI